MAHGRVHLAMQGRIIYLFIVCVSFLCFCFLLYSVLELPFVMFCPMQAGCLGGGGGGDDSAALCRRGRSARRAAAGGGGLGGAVGGAPIGLGGDISLFPLRLSHYLLRPGYVSSIGLPICTAAACLFLLPTTVSLFILYILSLIAKTKHV